MTEEELTELFADNSAAIYRYCAFRLGSTQDAEDATSEVFVRLVRAGDGVRPGRRARWLFTVARNVCTDMQRAPSAHRAADGDAPEQATEDPPPMWTDPAVRQAVSTLTAGQQQVVFLRLFEDMSFARIGRLVGRSEVATRMQYHRAMRSLRRRLGGPDGEEVRA